MFEKVVTFIKGLLDEASVVLKGEPARVIGYGAAVVIYLVAAAFGRIPDVSFDVAVTDAVGIVALVTAVVESVRHFVSSPITVGSLIDEIAELKADIAAYEAKNA